MGTKSPGYGLGGKAGKDGASPSLSIGTVTTLPPSSSATASVTGTSPDLKLNLGLVTGQSGATPTLSIGSVTTLPAGTSATASVTGAGALSFGIPAGPAGSNATATPLGTALPKALGTAAAGSSTNAAREDHVHPAPGLAVQFAGNVTVSRTLLIALSSGMQREYVTLTGIATTDKLMFAAIAACSAGCEPINVYPDTNRVLFSYNTPALGIGAVINLQIAVYKVV